MLQPINRIDPFGTHLRDWAEEQALLFARCKHATIEVYMELSRNGRFHFHGRIKFESIICIMYFYSVDLRRLHASGTGEIDTETDPMKWNLYCRKQFDYMSEFASLENIGFHHIKTNSTYTPEEED